MNRREMIIFVIGIVLMVIALAAAYISIFGRPNAVLPKNIVKIDGATFHVEIASTTVEQARGLSFRSSLDPNTGMLFTFDHPSVQNFWMKDMNFPIDMIWIGGGKVVGFAENAMPQPGVPLWGLKIYSSPDGTDQVLEVNAGMVSKYSIKVGDAVEANMTN